MSPSINTRKQRRVGHQIKSRREYRTIRTHKQDLVTLMTQLWIVKTRSTVKVPIELQKHDILKVSRNKIWVLRLQDMCFGVIWSTFVLQNSHQNNKIPYFCQFVLTCEPKVMIWQRKFFLFVQWSIMLFSIFLFFLMLMVLWEK